MNYAAFNNRCTEMGTTPTAISQKIGLKKGNATNWSKGGNPSVDVLMKLAVELNCSTDYLLGLDELPNRKENFVLSTLPNGIEDIINLASQISELDRGKLIGYAQKLIDEQKEKALDYVGTKDAMEAANDSNFTRILEAKHTDTE